MAIIKCPECGGNVSDMAKACPHCGFELNRCPECGGIIKEGVSNCPHCGIEVSKDKEAELLSNEATKEQAEPTQSKSKWYKSWWFATCITFILGSILFRYMDMNNLEGKWHENYSYTDKDEEGSFRLDIDSYCTYSGDSVFYEEGSIKYVLSDNEDSITVNVEYETDGVWKAHFSKKKGSRFDHMTGLTKKYNALQVKNMSSTSDSDIDAGEKEDIINVIKSGLSEGFHVCEYKVQKMNKYHMELIDEKNTVIICEKQK